MCLIHDRGETGKRKMGTKPNSTEPYLDLSFHCFHFSFSGSPCSIPAPRPLTTVV